MTTTESAALETTIKTQNDIRGSLKKSGKATLSSDWPSYLIGLVTTTNTNKQVDVVSNGRKTRQPDSAKCQLKTNHTIASAFLPGSEKQ